MSHRTLVMTVVQLAEDKTPALSLNCSGPGVVGQDRIVVELRLPEPEDVIDSRDWVRQILAAACEAL